MNRPPGMGDFGGEDKGPPTEAKSSSVISNAHNFFNAGDYSAARTALGETLPRAFDREELATAQAWHLMRAEISMVEGEFSEARRLCRDGAAVKKWFEDRGIPGARFFDAAFTAVEAEAMRRAEEPLPKSITMLMEWHLSTIRGSGDGRHLLDQRASFVEYYILRTLALDLRAKGRTREAQVLLDGAAQAHHAYRYADLLGKEPFRRGLYADYARGARRDEEEQAADDANELTNPDRSPSFVHANWLPF